MQVPFDIRGSRLTHRPAAGGARPTFVCQSVRRAAVSTSSRAGRLEAAESHHDGTPQALLQRWCQVPAATLAALTITLCSSAWAGGPAAAGAEEQQVLAAPTITAEALAAQQFTPTGPVFDGARVISPDKERALVEQLVQLEQETGWRVRGVVSFGTDGRPSDTALRAAWKPDKRTVVIAFDLSNPNLINPIYLGDEVLFKLRRPWWFELQGRYGNMFYVREEGEQKAVLTALSVVAQCLGAPEGCKVVPGLPEDQYQLTLALSVAGGIVAGSVLRLEPTGWIKERWQWLVVFFPLWGSLFVSFGLGPVLSRTSDPLPLLENTLAFVVSAATPTVLSNILSPPPAPPPQAGPGGGGGGVDQGRWPSNSDDE